MKRILLTQGRVALIDDVDYDSLNKYKWCTVKGSHNYYAVRGNQMSDSKWRNIFMHRVILNAPHGIEVDHINGNGLDNRRSNLRLCNHGENQRNQNLHRNNIIRLKGVRKLKRNLSKPYMARIQTNNKEFHIGCYQTPEEAARAYDLVAIEHHGEFAMTNKMLGLIK